MAAVASPKVQLSVRVDQRVMSLLDAQVVNARRRGRRVTKEELVSDAILSAYPGSGETDWLPVHTADWTAQIDPRSNTALLDFLDSSEES